MADREFVPIEVKSVLNRVSGMPFRWSINPYRGCSHACPFCASGETPILMADGTTMALEEIRVGDQVYGTVRRGAYRRYTPTFVFAHWAVRKPAYRVTLEDGTQLIASGDHRFLTDRGWKFVTDAEQGRVSRAHLTTNNKLMGTGAFATMPPRTDDYKRGYLCGLIRGDGYLGFHQYRRRGGALDNQCQFRLALTDREALDRARGYLLGFGVPTRSSVFQKATPVHRGLRAIGTGVRRLVEDVERIVAWPSESSSEWCKGFLAGIFDAEGGYNGGILRISNTNHVLVEQVTRCLKHLGLSSVVETQTKSGAKPIEVVRLLGGLGEHFRFFHSVDPAITRKRAIEGRAVKSTPRLRVAGI